MRRRSSRGVTKQLALCSAPAASRTRAVEEAEERISVLDRLPLEVISLVASHCSPKDLLAFGSSCNETYEIALTCPQSIWTRVILPSGYEHNHDNASDVDVERTSQLLKFISLRPHLVEQLREVHLHTSRTGDKALNGTMFSNLAKVIRMKPPLQSVAIHGELFGEELPPILLELIFNHPTIESLSFVAIAWPRIVNRPAIKQSVTPKRVLKRMQLVAAHTAFLARVCNSFGEIELLDLAHMHGLGVVGADCATLWQRTRGLVVGVHATQFVVEQLRRFADGNGELDLRTLFLHELLSPAEFEVITRCLTRTKQLKTLAINLPAEMPVDYVEMLAEAAPELETLALNLDFLGTSPDVRERKWSIQTRRGTVQCDMPEGIDTWQQVLLALLPWMTSKRFPRLRQLVVRHPGTKIWSCARDPPTQPDALLTEFFTRAFAALPMLQKGALAWRCCQVGRGDGPNTLSLEVHPDLEYSMGICSAMRWVWHRIEGESTRLQSRELFELSEGFDHPLIQQSAFSDELPSL